MTQVKAKSNSIITTVLSADGNTITFQVKGAGELRLDLGKVSAAVQRRATIHGLVQRVSDKAAISRNTETGLPATPEDKLSAMRGLVEHFQSGTDDWSPARREGGRKAKPEVLDPIIIAAVCEVLGKDEAKVRALIKSGAEKHGKSQVVFLAALWSGKKVAPVVERLRAEQASDLDGDELMEGWGNKNEDNNGNTNNQ